MTIQVITPLPTPVPSRLDPVNFAARADAFLASLPTFGDELNDFASEANALALEVQDNKDSVDATYVDMQELETTMQGIYSNSVATGNFKGVWSSLTGSLVKPATVFNAGSYWILLENLVDVTASEPTVSNSAWLEFNIKALDVTYNNSIVDLEASNIQSAIELLRKKYSSTNNRLVNPEFMISQEYGEAIVPIPVGAVKFVLDQWYALSVGSTITAQQVNGISGRQKSLRFTGSTSNIGFNFGQRIESSSCYDLKNQIVTVSFKAKASSARVVNWAVYHANVIDNFTTGTTISTGNFNVTTEATSFSFSFNAGENAGNGLLLTFETFALLAGQTIEFDQVQLEKSNIPTEFLGRSKQQELALCQRYFLFLPNILVETLGNYSTYIFPVTMRTTPTISGGGSGFLQNASSSILMNIAQNSKTFQNLSVSARL